MLSLLPPKAKPEPAKPTSHTERKLEGWTIRVDDRLLHGPDEALGTRALRFLEGKLSDIKAVVPGDKLKKLQAVVIVLDLTHGKLGPMQYHPSAGWLKANGYATDLEKCVHIPRAADLPTIRNIREQPWVILHELAHAYHDQVLSFEEPRIIEAYEKYKKSGHGDKTLLYDGQRVRHYALTNQMEFFAEMTEAYFGVNDFFPFNRAELKEAEPAIYTLLSDVWAPGEDKPKTKVLFIGKDPDHPYGSHMYLHTCGMLAKCVELTPGVEVVVSNGWPKDAKKLEGVKTIVVYTSPGAELLLEGPHRAQVDDLMKKGVGLVTIHWASSVLKADYDRLGPTWLGYLGGTWVSNVGLSGGKSPLKQLLPEHAVCRGWKEFEIDDEFYLDPVIKQAKPLLQVRDRKDKEVIVGWVFDRPDGGRSFATTLGHPYKNFQTDAFRRLLVNAILWSAHVEVPKDGAPVAISAKDLALPPEKPGK